MSTRELRVTPEKLDELYCKLLDGETKINVDDIYKIICDFSSDYDEIFHSDTKEDDEYIVHVSSEISDKLDRVITWFLSQEELQDLVDRIEKLIPKDPEHYAPHIIACMWETLNYKLAPRTKSHI